MHHAAAQRCAMQLALDEPAGWLSLSIQDDGCGLPLAKGVGVGLASMRERAEELGGICRIEPAESGGTRVLARLPYARTESADAGFVTPHLSPQEGGISMDCIRVLIADDHALFREGLHGLLDSLAETEVVGRGHHRS